MLVQARFLAISTAVLVGMGSTLWGLSGMPWRDVLPAFPYADVAFLTGAAVLVEMLARWLSISRLVAGAVTAGLIAVLAGAVWPLLVTLWFAVASFIVGRFVLGYCGVDTDRLSPVSVFLAGAVVYGTAAGVLAHFPVNYPGLYGIALMAPVAFAWRSVFCAAQLAGTELSRLKEAGLLDLAIALVALVHFVSALMPVMGHDALAMHLFIPGHMASRHQWGFDVTTYVWAVMPMLGDWIFSIGYMLGGETAARLTNVGFVFLLGWLLRDLVMWAGGNALGARWAVLVFLTTPLVFAESSTLFIDPIWASLVVAGTLSVLRFVFCTDDSKTDLTAAGIVLGGALAAKAVTFTILPALLLLLLVRSYSWLNLNLTRTLVTGLVLFLTAGAVPYITAWYLTGNPVFPFFNEYFQSPQYPMKNFSTAHLFEQGVSWNTLYRITFDSASYLESRPGAAGFQWLLLFLPASVMLLVTLHRKGVALFSVGVVAVVFTFHQTAYLRYVLPSFVILTAMTGVVISVALASGNIRARRLLLVLCVATVGLNILFFKSATYYGDMAVEPLLSDADRFRYLEQRLPVRNAVDLVNLLNTDRRAVAVFSLPLTAGIYADALYPSWYNREFNSLVKNADSAYVMADTLLAKGVDYVILDSAWGTAGKREIIAGATRKIADFGPVSVRQVRDEYRFIIELLEDPDFSGSEHWQLSKGSKLVAGGVEVGGEANAIQIVPVTGRRRYLLTVKAGCLQGPAKGRLQVNWLNEESEFIGTNIDVFDCSRIPAVYSMEVIAPNDASQAVIYAAGHAGGSLIVNTVSFRK